MISTRFSGRADRYTEQDESRTRAMPNDRVQLRPPRRLLAASAAVCTKTQKLLRVKELDPRVCVIDAFSVCSALSLFFLSRHSSLVYPGPAGSGRLLRALCVKSLFPGLSPLCALCVLCVLCVKSFLLVSSLVTRHSFTSAGSGRLLRALCVKSLFPALLLSVNSDDMTPAPPGARVATLAHSRLASAWTGGADGSVHRSGFACPHTNSLLGGRK